MMEEKQQLVYELVDEVCQVMSFFYVEKGGFGYDVESVVKWLNFYFEVVLFKLCQGGCVFDFCCGDGVWLWGLKVLWLDFEFYGVDIVVGGIEVL